MQKDTKFFKQYGYLFYKNLISKAEIRNVSNLQKYAERKIMMNKVYKYYENHIKKRTSKS